MKNNVTKIVTVYKALQYNGYIIYEQWICVNYNFDVSVIRVEYLDIHHNSVHM
jgi:hypothetical protein